MILWVKYPCVMNFHGNNAPCALPIYMDITTMYFHPEGYLHPWIRFYIRVDLRTAPVTDVRNYTTVILGDTVLLALTGSPELQSPITIYLIFDVYNINIILVLFLLYLVRITIGATKNRKNSNLYVLILNWKWTRCGICGIS